MGGWCRRCRCRERQGVQIGDISEVGWLAALERQWLQLVLVKGLETEWPDSETQDESVQVRLEWGDHWGMEAEAQGGQEVEATVV